MGAAQNGTWEGINPEFAARMKVQNRFKTGLDIARYTASIMRKDMAEYDADSSQYTQSLGCWHGFVGQQKCCRLKNIKAQQAKATFTFQAGWLRHFAQNLALYQTNQCMKKHRYLHSSRNSTPSFAKQMRENWVTFSISSTMLRLTAAT